MQNSLQAKESAADAELALKAHIFFSEPEIRSEVTGWNQMRQQIAGNVDLTEAPEDALCSLVIDLLQYCERERINWTQDVMSRALDYIRDERIAELDH